MNRRRFLALPMLAAVAAPAATVSAAEGYPDVLPGRPLAFPADHGAHPAFRNEWWYITGWLVAAGRPLGFQVTFFRNRPRIAEESASRFAPKQLLFAHAAIADAREGRLLHDQRAAREGFDIAVASASDTDVRIAAWSLRRTDKRYEARIEARDFDLRLAFTPTQALLLQGEQGVSRKGPLARQASYYYSWPQLAVDGEVAVRGAVARVSGRAWLDHEWSSEPLAAGAAGWDWVGLNGEDGSALMAFRIRARDGSVVWAGGSHRRSDGTLTIFRPADVRFEVLRTWKSPRTGAVYPVAMKLRAGDSELALEPLMDDQEVDARASTATIYWEGAVEAAATGGKGDATAAASPRYGTGYLELTGYWQPLKL